MSDNKDLISRLNNAAAQIHKSSTRGSVNFMVTSSYVSNIIKNLDRIGKRIIKIKNIYGCE